MVDWRMTYRQLPSLKKNKTLDLYVYEGQYGEAVVVLTTKTFKILLDNFKQQF